MGVQEGIQKHLQAILQEYALVLAGKEGITVESFELRYSIGSTHDSVFVRPSVVAVVEPDNAGEPAQIVAETPVEEPPADEPKQVKRKGKLEEPSGDDPVG